MKKNKFQPMILGVLTLIGIQCFFGYCNAVLLPDSSANPSIENEENIFIEPSFNQDVFFKWKVPHYTEEQLRSIANPPSIQELINLQLSHGLDLDKVKLRQDWLRVQGQLNSISSSPEPSVDILNVINLQVMLDRSIRVKNKKIVDLNREIQEINQKLINANRSNEKNPLYRLPFTNQTKEKRNDKSRLEYLYSLLNDVMQDNVSYSGYQDAPPSAFHQDMEHKKSRILKALSPYGFTSIHLKNLLTMVERVG